MWRSPLPKGIVGGPHEVPSSRDLRRSESVRPTIQGCRACAMNSPNKYKNIKTNIDDCKKHDLRKTPRVSRGLLFSLFQNFGGHGMSQFLAIRFNAAAAVPQCHFRIQSRGSCQIKSSDIFGIRVESRPWAYLSTVILYPVLKRVWYSFA